MKRFCAAALCVLSLCGCAAQGGEQADVQVQQYWDALESAQFEAKILSDLGQSTVEYTLDYAYNCKGSDAFTLTAPEALAGISGTIAGDTSLTLQYDGTVLDAPGSSRAGLTPADAVPYLLRDLRAESPSEIWTERAGGESYTVLQYVHEDDGNLMRQVWLQGNVPVRAEIFAEGARVLTCTFRNWTE